jgi:dihydrofolate reductase
MKLVVTEFMTLDGAFEAPEEWSFAYWGDDISAFKDEERQSADALLLGRKTFETFAAAWPARSGTFADRMNSLPKYFVSKSLTAPQWNNSRRIDGDVLASIRELKSQPGRNLLVDGSATLVQCLLEHGLVDRLTLLVFPLILGRGKRSLLELTGSTKLRLVRCEAFASGVAALSYDAAPQPG